MTITFPLTLPNSGAAVSDIETISFYQRAVVAAVRSPFSGVMQVYRHPGQWWEATVKLPLMSRAAAEPWVALLTSLNTREGTFLMGDPNGRRPRGSASGTALLVGSHAAFSNTLTVDGFPSSAQVLKAGDWIQVGSATTARLHKNLQDVWTNSGGQATLDVWPFTRVALEDNATVVYSNTVGVWRLADNAQAWEITAPGNIQIAFTAVEAI